MSIRNSNELFYLCQQLQGFLTDPPDLPLSDIVGWERQLVQNPNDATIREVYADWLAERGCSERECEVRTSAERIRRHPTTIEGILDRATKFVLVGDSVTFSKVQVEVEYGEHWGVGCGVNRHEVGSGWEITGYDPRDRVFIFTRVR